MKISTILGSTLLLAAAIPAFAQDEAPKFKIQPTGRVLADGALFAPTDDGKFADGVNIADVRMGVKAYYGNWMAKIDVGYGFGQISMKDVYIQYKFNDKNLIRGGYFVHQFGLQAATSSSMKPTFEAPITDTYMNATGRNLGIMYQYNGDKFLANVSGIAGTQITTAANTMGRVSAGGITRLLYRPIHTPGTIAQVGMSGWYQSAMHKREGDVTSPGYFTYSANYPTRVDKVSLLSTTVNDANGVVKLSPEWLVSKGRFAFEGQYYYMNINRKHDLSSFTAQGIYGELRALVFGDKKYGYASGDGGLATPAPKTLECVVGYNYTDATDSKAGTYGGITNDYSVTFNYYINKYMLARLRYSYTDLRQSGSLNDAGEVNLNPKSHVNIIEARIQFMF